MSTVIPEINHLVREIDKLDEVRFSVYTGPNHCEGCGVVLQYLSRQHLPLYWEAGDQSIVEYANNFKGAKIVEAPANAIPFQNRDFGPCLGPKSEPEPRRYIPKWLRGRKNQ